MNLLKLKAKVLLQSEEQMEAEDKYDLGNIAKSKEWVWRYIAIPVHEVYRVIEFNKSKCIVQLYDEEKILVAEPFDDVFVKWEELKDMEAIAEKIHPEDLEESPTEEDEEE